MVVLAIVGLGVASYLTYVHYSGTRPACTAGGSCVKVQTSEWSKVGGVPVALIGLIGYIGIFASLIAPDRDETRLATLGMTLIGVGFSGYLTYRELFSIHAVCEWCASSAVILALLFIGAVWRFLITDDLALVGFGGDASGSPSEAPGAGPGSARGRRSATPAGRA